MARNGLCLGWLLEGHAPLHGNAKFQPLKTCDRSSLCKGHMAKAQEGLVVSGVEGGWYVRTPDHELV